MILVHLREGQFIPVHEGVLAQMKNLPAIDEQGERAGRRLVDLRHVSLHTGHALIQYLYAGNYDAKTHADCKPASTATNQFGLHLELYALSKSYELPGLTTLATKKLLALKMVYTPSTLLRAVSKASPAPMDDDEWYRGYVKLALAETYPTLRSFLDASLRYSKADHPEDCHTRLSSLFLTLMLELDSDEAVVKGEGKDSDTSSDSTLYT